MKAPMSGTAYPFVIDILRRRLRPGERVLEIGCGAMQYQPLLAVVYEGLDLPDSPYLEATPDYACSAEAIPCEDGRFDLVFGVATFLIIRDVDRAFAECRRVLRAGGRLVVFDYQRHVCERLRRADPDHRHAWDFADMRRRLIDAGFVGEHVRDITHEALGRTRLHQLAWRLVSATSRRLDWLIMEAVR